MDTVERNGGGHRPDTPVPTVDVDRTDPQYRVWLKEAVRKVQADANRSADTHLLRFPLPDALGHRPVPQGRVDPPHRQPQAPAGPLAVPLRAVQRLDPARASR